MLNKRKIYVVGGGINYANWMNGTLVKSLDEADLVVFTGGEDVHPRMYNEPTGSRTHFNLARDLYEKKFFELATEKKKHIIGICRGSQFVCALSGGRLVQHQSNPSFIHKIETNDGRNIPITSTHHQAQYPYDMDNEKYKLLAWTKGISEFHLDGNDKEIAAEAFKEAEIVYYPETKALGIQGHPEAMHGQEEYNNTFEYLNELLNNFLEDKL